MVKTEITKNLERALWNHTKKMGTFGCFEVSIGFNGEYRGKREVVDYITYDTKGEFRCYEIKVSKADYLSTAEQTFLGHWNYLVMPEELYETLKAERLLPWGIGVYVRGGGLLRCVVKARKRQVSLGMSATLMESMVRSLHRETSKFYKVKGYWE